MNGWSESAFTIGIDVLSAKSSRLRCENTLATTQSTNLSRTLATSATGSLIPRPISLLLKKIHDPPICFIPTSKLTLVLSEGFSKTNATVLSDKIWGVFPCLIDAAFEIMLSTSPSFKSKMERKFLFFIL